MMMFTVFIFFFSTFFSTAPAVHLNVSGLTVEVSNDLVKLKFKSDSTVSSLYVGNEDIISDESSNLHIKSFYLDWTGTGMFFLILFIIFLKVFNFIFFDNKYIIIGITHVCKLS